MVEVIDQVNKNNFNKMLNELLIIQATTQRIISIIGWEFDTSCTVYCDATSHEVKSGWDFLTTNSIPLDTYVRAFLIKSIDDLLNPEEPKESGEWVIDVKSEPDVMELLRLCYWIDRCRSFTDNSFLIKLNEIKDQLALGGGDKLGESFAKRCRLISKILLNSRIPRWERNLHKICFLNELNKFRIAVSSFVSEIMLAAILRNEGFNVKFPAQTAHEKICDMLVASSKVEVKTVFDQTKFSETEDTLCKELEATLKRKKIVDDIDDALLKEPDIIFLILTFSSVGISVNDAAIGGKIFPSITESVNKSIDVSNLNKSKVDRLSISEIPLVIFVTGVNYSNKIYQLSSLQISYPVDAVDYQLKANSNRLKIKV